MHEIDFEIFNEIKLEIKSEDENESIERNTIDWIHTLLLLARISFNQPGLDTGISQFQRYAILQSMNEVFMDYKCRTGEDVPISISDPVLRELALEFEQGRTDTVMFHGSILDRMNDLIDMTERGILFSTKWPVFTVTEFLKVLNVHCIVERT